MMRALVIQHPPIDLILAKTKTWEIRGSPTNVREQIGLIASGSGTVIGVCRLVGCKGPLTAAQFRRNAKKAGLCPNEAKRPYAKTYAWVLEKARRLKQPVKYRHRSGAIIWVRLKLAVEAKVKAQLGKRKVSKKPARPASGSH